MAKTKTVAAKEKAVAPKKPAASRSTSSSPKPVKLGGVPNQGRFQEEQ